MIRQGKNADKMIKQHDHRRNKSTREFKIGDTVSVLIPRIDRGGSDLPRLPSRVLKISGQKDFMYQIITKYGIIDNYLRICDLEPYHGLVEDKIKDNITLREAARLAANRVVDLKDAVVSCNCNGPCNEDNRCSCYKLKYRD